MLNIMIVVCCISLVCLLIGWIADKNRGDVKQIAFKVIQMLDKETGMSLEKIREKAGKNADRGIEWLIARKLIEHKFKSEDKPGTIILTELGFVNQKKKFFNELE